MNVLESGTIPLTTVTSCVLEAGAVQLPFVKRLYVTVPAALLEAPVRVAVSCTVVLVRIVVLVTSLP